MKKLLAIILALCMMLSLCACGDKGGKADYLGLYEGVTMNMFGETVDMSEVYDGVNTLELLSGGKCEITLGGDTAEATYKVSGKEMTITIEGEKIEASLQDGVVVMDFFGVEMTFAKKGYQSSAGNGGNTSGDNGAVFPEDVAEEFYGDWHGWCAVVDGTDDYEDEIGNEFEMLARFAIDADGVCQPWMSIYSNSEDNFKDVTVYYDEDDQFVHMEGQLFGMTIEPHSEIYYTYGSLVMTLYLKGNNGTMQIAVTLRQPETEWDSYDFPCMPADAQEFYKDKSFEEIVELYGLDMADLPELP